MTPATSLIVRLTSLSLIATFAMVAAPAQAAGAYDEYPACKAVQSKAAPSKDQPSKDEIANLKGCNAERAYYGIGEPTDYKKARHCSFAQLANNEEAFWGGRTILYMIYANGFGVTQNLDLALKYACDLGGAEMEINGRIGHLEELRKTPGEKPVRPLDYCDDITSGYAQGFCRQVTVDRNAAERDSKFAKLPFRADAKFVALKTAALQFRDARVNNEVDMSGTARAANMLSEENIQDQDFLNSVEMFAANKAPKFDLKKENDLMNKTFKKIMANKEKAPWGTVTKDGVIKTQKAWVAYRNAWRAFAGPAKADLVDAWFTKKRTHMLSSILGER